MHDIKAMRTAEETPVFQIPENRLRFPYPHQRLSLFFLGAGHPSQVFNNLSISLPLLRAGGARSSSLPSNICPSFLHRCFLGSHLRDPWNIVFEDPGSFPSWRYVVSSMHLTQAQNPWTTCPEKYPNPR